MRFSRFVFGARFRRRIGSGFVALAVLALAQPSFAQQNRSFSPQLFHPAPGADEFVTIESAIPLAHKGYGFGLYTNYARDPLSILGFNAANKSSTGIRSDVISAMVGSELWAALGLFNRLQLAISWPMTLYQTGTTFKDSDPAPDGTTIKAPNGFALGDPRLYAKVRAYGYEQGFQLGFSTWLSFPFGNDSNFGGEKHFSGFAGEVRALAGWEHDRIHLGVSLGVHWRGHESALFSTTVGQEFTFGGAFQYDVVRKRFAMVAEIYGSHDFASDENVSFLEIDLAGKIMMYRGLSLNIGVGTGLISGLGSPEPRAFLGVVYAPDMHDRDKDGVPDAYDLCPDLPEDRDGFQDKDGCPDNDNDRDSIPDKLDKCPNQPEDFDEFQDEDGCPDPDNDNDGIIDGKDECPNEPEDGKPPHPMDGCPVGKGPSAEEPPSDETPAPEVAPVPVEPAPAPAPTPPPAKSKRKPR